MIIWMFEDCSFHYSLTSYPIKKVTGLIFKCFVVLQFKGATTAFAVCEMSLLLNLSYERVNSFTRSLGNPSVRITKERNEL